MVLDLFMNTHYIRIYIFKTVYMSFFFDTLAKERLVGELEEVERKCILFCAFEEVCKYFSHLTAPNTAGLKAEFTGTLCSSEDVEFYWCIITADFDIDDADVYQNMLDLVVTVKHFIM